MGHSQSSAWDNMGSLKSLWENGVYWHENTAPIYWVTQTGYKVVSIKWLKFCKTVNMCRKMGKVFIKIITVISLGRF
jgi:hypothetical protein